MDIRHFPQRLEIAFWSVLIALMRQAPDQCRFFLRIHVYIWSPSFARLVNRVLFWSLVGLLLGFALGFAGRFIA